MPKANWLTASNKHDTSMCKCKKCKDFLNIYVGKFWKNWISMDFSGMCAEIFPALSADLGQIWGEVGPTERRVTSFCRSEGAKTSATRRAKPQRLWQHIWPLRPLKLCGVSFHKGLSLESEDVHGFLLQM